MFSQKTYRLVNHNVYETGLLMKKSRNDEGYYSWSYLEVMRDFRGSSICGIIMGLDSSQLDSIGEC